MDGMKGRCWGAVVGLAVEDFLGTADGFFNARRHDEGKNGGETQGICGADTPRHRFVGW
jgi:hypothetical protein